MHKLSKPLFLICETPLHAGSGDSLGIVDMPIQRERHTSFPKIEASSLKGALREAFEDKFIVTNPKRDHADIRITFGSDDSGEQAGALAFSDARLLLFPVKSMKGVFAWVTCPRVLRQFEKDINLAYQTEGKTFSIDGLSQLQNPTTPNECYSLGGSTELKIGNTNKIVLEEYAFIATSKELKVGEKTLQEWIAENLFKDNELGYWNGKAKSSIVILSDDDFKDFVNLSTEVITRTKINNETGTVQTGALFTEEYLPSESVMYSLVFASAEFSKEKGKTATDNMTFFETNLLPVFQLGGNSTLGKGILRTIFEKSKNESDKSTKSE